MKSIKILVKKHSRESMLLAVILLIGMVVTLVNPAFFTYNNIFTILNSNAVLGIMSVGMMVIIITGNIDLSTGVVFSVSGMVVGTLAAYWQGRHVLVLVLLAIVSGAILGIINGFFVAKLNIPAIIVTLATTSILKGGLILITDGVWVEEIAGPFTKFANYKIGPINTAILCWVAVLILSWLLLYKTKIGRDIMAVGGNASGAVRIGVNLFTVYMFSFALIGALAGLGSALSVSRLTTAHPTAGVGIEMKMIAAVVIGGTVFEGGKASVLGTFLGVLLFGVIENALVLLRVPVFWQNLVTGLVLLLAIISSARSSIAIFSRQYKTQMGVKAS